MIEAKRGLRWFNASERSKDLGPCGKQQSVRISVIAYRLRVHARTITMLLLSQTVITKNTGHHLESKTIQYSMILLFYSQM